MAHRRGSHRRIIITDAVPRMQGNIGGGDCKHAVACGHACRYRDVAGRWSVLLLLSIVWALFGIQVTKILVFPILCSAIK